MPATIPNGDAEIDALVSGWERRWLAMRPLYRAGTDCPACWGRAWAVGRQTAECGKCGCVLPLAHDLERAA